MARNLETITCDRIVTPDGTSVLVSALAAADSQLPITSVAIVDNSGGATADGTIAIVTAPTALTDNGGGTADATVASQAAPVTLTDSTGQSGTHDDTLAATTVPTITATNPAAPTAYSAVVNMTDPVTKAEGEAVSAGLATLRGEVATYETAISALVVDVAAILALQTVQCQNASDTGQKVIELVTLGGVARDNLKELTTAQAANRLAIVALTDAVKEITTKLNAVIAELD